MVLDPNLTILEMATNSTDSTKNFAHFREIPVNNQCELTFLLETTLTNCEKKINSNIKAVRQMSDNVEGLLNHIVNKVENVLKTGYEIEAFPTEDITVALINAETLKSIKPSRILKSLFADKLQLEFHIFDQVFKVLYNSPVVKELTLPNILYVQSHIQPQKCNTNFASSKDSKYFWYKSIDKKNWEEVARSFRYNIKEKDLGYYLKFVCIPIRNAEQGPKVEVISLNPVEQIGAVPICPFEDRHEFTKTKLTGNKFRVVSYNILSSRYSEINDQFKYCSPRALAVDYRKHLIGKELLGYNADIICLQEVDNGPYITYYRDLFKEHGYMSFYHKKGNKIPEGLLCIFNKNRFKKLESYQIVYSEEIIKSREFYYIKKLLKNNPKLKEYFLKQATSLQITIFKQKNQEGDENTPTQKHNFIIVANSHLFYHPDAEPIRLLQVDMATTHLKFLVSKYSKNGNNAMVIFCGDFNCKPTSQVFNYMTSGKLDSNTEVSKRIADNANLHHSFIFESACGIPKYTNYTEDFKDCLDYIFIEKNKCRVLNMVPFPEDDVLGRYVGLPNDVFPSDHLALIVDLEIL